VLTGIRAIATGPRNARTTTERWRPHADPVGRAGCPSPGDGARYARPRPTARDSSRGRLASGRSGVAVGKCYHREAKLVRRWSRRAAATRLVPMSITSGGRIPPRVPNRPGVGGHPLDGAADGRTERVSGEANMRRSQAILGLPVTTGVLAKWILHDGRALRTRCCTPRGRGRPPGCVAGDPCFPTIKNAQFFVRSRGESQRIGIATATRTRPTIGALPISAAASGSGAQRTRGGRGPVGPRTRNKRTSTRQRAARFFVGHAESATLRSARTTTNREVAGSPRGEI